jgi:hypothetical protein
VVNLVTKVLSCELRFSQPGSTDEVPRVCRHLNEKMPSDLGLWEVFKLPSARFESRTQVRLLYCPVKTRAVFDGPNLLPHAGLAPMMVLAERAGLPDLLAGVRPGGPCGVTLRDVIAGSSRTPLRHARRTRAIWQY